MGQTLNSINSPETEVDDPVRANLADCRECVLLISRLRAWRGPGLNTWRSVSPGQRDWPNFAEVNMSSSEDPRRLNCQFDFESIRAHVKGYADALSRALLSLDWHQLDLAVAEIEGARRRRSRLWVAGNGGSAAIADHLLCDWVKGTFTASQTPIHVHSLVSNTALLTACANDFGYEVSFARQIEMQGQSERHFDLHFLVGKQRKHFGGVA